MIQLQVLNYILTTKDSSLITLNNLTDVYFSNYKDEFNYIKNHLSQYNTIPDKETFLNIFPNFDLINVNETPNYLIHELYNDYNTRTLAETFNKIRTSLMNNDVENALIEYNTVQSKLTSGKCLTSVDILKDTSRYNDYVSRVEDFKKFYVKTGFPELDKVIGGWDREEDYVTIAARPGVGKSWILIKCALAAVEQGLNVGLYSGEMSERMVGYRFDSLVSHISNGAMVHGNDNIMVDYKKYIDELPNKYKGSLKILTPKLINGPATVSVLRAFIEKENLDILFIDQHSLLVDEHKAKNPIDRAANISKDIQLLQSTLKKPIITVSQQNRVKNDEGPGTENISQSDRISQDSSLVIFIDKKDDILKLIIAKSRFSQSGLTLTYHVDLNTGTFDYIPSEDESDEQSDSDLESRYTEKIEGEDVF